MLNIKVTSGLLGNTTFGAYYRSVAGTKENNAYTVLVELDDLENAFSMSWLIDRKNADVLNEILNWERRGAKSLMEMFNTMPPSGLLHQSYEGVESPCEMYKWDRIGSFTMKNVSPETVKKIAELAFLNSEANMHVWNAVRETFKSFQYSALKPGRKLKVTLTSGICGITPEEFDADDAPTWKMNHLVVLVSVEGDGTMFIINMTYNATALEKLLGWDSSKVKQEFVVDTYQWEQLERLAYLRGDFQCAIWGGAVLDTFTPLNLIG